MCSTQHPYAYRFMLNQKIKFSVLVLTVLLFALACRTADTLVKIAAAPTARPRATRTVTRRPTRATPQTQPTVELPTTIVEATTAPQAATDVPPPPAPKTPLRPPTSRPVVPPTSRPPNTSVPPSPTSPYIYRIQESRCGPNVRTYIEGFVYEGSTGKNGLLVRISQGPDGQPDPNDDYRTGTDPKRNGYYYQNIDSNAPHEGTWYLWVIDPATQKRISEIAIVKTDKTRVEDSGNSSGSCQSATVNFSTQGPGPTARPSSTPRATRDPNAAPTPSPTHDPLDDSSP